MLLQLNNLREFSFIFSSDSEAGLLNKRLMLSSNFRCDQIYKYEIYNFGHTLLCYLLRLRCSTNPPKNFYFVYLFRDVLYRLYRNKTVRSSILELSDKLD
jgi:hypothetical protein